MSMDRSLSWDWYGGTIPANVMVHETAYVETSFSFNLFRSEAPVGVSIGKGASAYVGSMFDVGPRGRVVIGDYALVHGAHIVCDDQVEIGDYALISWNVLLMDTYRVPVAPSLRREELLRASGRPDRFPAAEVDARPVRIGRNVWIGFGVCVLPGVTVGEGSIVGARSVVVEDVPPYSVIAGNPARLVRRLEGASGE